ncbi:DUF4158 domain-containing protein [Nonomuraea sp. M3C6]|uniref:DUF4158 domain-containing protein n=1 Tax=Nonomuraea marmarensis TaxID=3351344 RepID=A0ABW7AR42_9ACTN
MDELIDHWTVLSDEVGLVSAKQEGTRLAFALLLKYFTQHGRFPRGRAEFPDEVVDYVARQAKTSAGSLACTTGQVGRSSVIAARSATTSAFGSARLPMATS